MIENRLPEYMDEKTKKTVANAAATIITKGVELSIGPVGPFAKLILQAFKIGIAK